ncbi:SIMPL domain-containing protein [Frigidibacter sp. ROC022]|uniref:SIMPL domain-containing protein n=1 Tax=Frigidibacter sp. ROC022 TaxID=2971796 RepID=UPI00215B0C14|nr:SIMPL domain-containing protein [Frigidibacter sp. ROC022]MCR8723846.1 SIMPL domain-containing protein [Frigidibacter sp. ROC022]
MKFLPCLFVALAFGPIAALPAAAQQGAGAGAVAPMASLTVSAEGHVDAAPDMAVVSVGVTTTGETAAGALAENSDRVAALLATLKRQGIEARDIQTSGLNLNPVFDKDGQKAGRQEITGYRVSNVVTVRVRALDRLGPVLDQMVENGANQLNGLSFGLSEPGPLQDQARERAVAEALRRARLLADAAGVELGRIVTIQEGGSSPGSQPMFAREAAMAVPVAGGEVSVQASVTIVFELAGQ